MGFCIMGFSRYGVLYYVLVSFVFNINIADLVDKRGLIDMGFCIFMSG